MTESPAINTSPLIFLSKANLLNLTAKQRGEISAARPVLEQLRLSGMYLSDQVMNQALALIGE